MNVQFCLDAVLSHPPFDQEEAASKTATLAFLRTHDRFWQRDNYAGHLTVSAWVVNPALSHVLLTHHKKLGRWLQLGGHIMDFIVSEESHDLAWFALQNLPEINHSPDLVRMVRKLN